MADKKTDKYVNIAVARVDFGAAGNCESTLLPTAININEKIGWVIHRIHAQLSITGASLTAGNILTWGLSSAAPPDGITYGGLRQPYIHTMHKYIVPATMVGAVGIIREEPIIDDFTSLPGGGRLVPPTPLYAYGDNIGVAVPGYVEIRVEYTQLPMTTDDFWDMVETYRYLGI